jgi:hypothetical protein
MLTTELRVDKCCKCIAGADCLWLCVDYCVMVEREENVAYVLGRESGDGVGEALSVDVVESWRIDGS